MDELILLLDFYGVYFLLDSTVPFWVDIKVIINGMVFFSVVRRREANILK